MSQWLNTEPGKKQLPPYGWHQTKLERIKAEPAKEVLARPAVQLATRCVAWLSKAIRWLTVRMEILRPSSNSQEQIDWTDYGESDVLQVADGAFDEAITLPSWVWVDGELMFACTLDGNNLHVRRFNWVRSSIVEPLDDSVKS